MTYAILLVVYLLGLIAGAALLWVMVKPRLDQLKRLTDRDERGRFVKRER